MSEQPLERWEGRTAAELAAKWGSAAVHLYQRVGSTNDIARQLGAGGAPAGTLVIAEEQMAGRGRAGRSWSSPAGLGLWLSLLLRTTADSHMSSLPLRVALALAGALERFTDPAPIFVKWPNDLLLHRRKVGGILCEGVWKGRHGSMVVGVGINVHHGAGDFPPELGDAATSLTLATGGVRPDRAEVASACVQALLGVGAADPLTEQQREDLAARDALHGEMISAIDPATGRVLMEGTATGFSADGALLIRSGSLVREVRSGSIRMGGV